MIEADDSRIMFDFILFGGVVALMVDVFLQGDHLYIIVCGTTAEGGVTNKV